MHGMCQYDKCTEIDLQDKLYCIEHTTTIRMLSVLHFLLFERTRNMMESYRRHAHDISYRVVT
jgi:hypothetical protein